MNDSGTRLHGDVTFLALLDAAAAELLDDDRPRWAIEICDDDAGQAVRRMNQSMIDIAILSAPDADTNTIDHYSHLQAQLAVTRGRAETYADVGLLCQRMPALADHLFGGMLSYEHLRILARAADGVARADSDGTAAVEKAIITALTPRRNGQAMPGPRGLYTRLARAIGEVDALARPLDPAGDPAARADRVDRRQVSVDTRDPETTTVTATLTAAEASEFLTILDAVCREHECSRADGLMHLARGTADVSVTLNVYREMNSDTSTTESGHWLDRLATDRFMQRVTHLRVSGHDRVETYVPTEQMRVFLRGRDGTCRFPGCDVAAVNCDIDHVRRYNHGDPSSGGPTDTRNLQCLCRRHHLLKTAGLADATIAADATVMWTSTDDGHTGLTEPSGPLAEFARSTFADEASRRYAAVREHNAQRLPDEPDSPDVPF